MLALRNYELIHDTSTSSGGYINTGAESLLNTAFEPMDFIYFKLQDLPMQAHLICQQGVYLSERKEGDYFVALYALNDFYVEVYYRFEDSEVIMITSFYSTNLLEPYLANMQLGRLFGETLINSQ